MKFRLIAFRKKDHGGGTVDLRNEYLMRIVGVKILLPETGKKIEIL